jgi:carotenoid cleavage dioxygenase-like enzyme
MTFAQEIWIVAVDAMNKDPIARAFMPFTTCEHVHGTWVPRCLLDQARKD